MLVLHYTGMSSAAAALARLRDAAAKVSAHYLVDEDGSIYALVEEQKSFGDALDCARTKVKSAGDPTWLAYTFYGNDAARVRNGAVAAPPPAPANSKPQSN